MTMSVVTSVNTVGSKKLPPCAARLPPVTTLAPFFSASAMCASTFSTAFHVNERPDYSTRLEPAGNLHGTGGLGEALGKGVVDAVLHQNPVGADGGLAGIAVFRGDRTLDRYLDIGVVEDDERRVAAQFERELLDRAGALLYQQFIDLGRAGEGQLADGRVRGQLAADPSATAHCAAVIVMQWAT
jgi:hypothetical protein